MSWSNLNSGTRGRLALIRLKCPLLCLEEGRGDVLQEFVGRSLLHPSSVDGIKDESFSCTLLVRFVLLSLEEDCNASLQKFRDFLFTVPVKEVLALSRKLIFELFIFCFGDDSNIWFRKTKKLFLFNSCSPLGMPKWRFSPWLRSDFFDRSIKSSLWEVLLLSFSAIRMEKMGFSGFMSVFLIFCSEDCKISSSSVFDKVTFSEGLASSPLNVALKIIK